MSTGEAGNIGLAQFLLLIFPSVLIADACAGCLWASEGTLKKWASEAQKKQPEAQINLRGC